MYSRTDQPHYAPASVGVLVDPEFLRGAALDAYGGRRPGRSPRVNLLLRCRAAMEAIAVLVRRR